MSQDGRCNVESPLCWRSSIQSFFRSVRLYSCTRARFVYSPIDQATVAVGATSGRRNSNGYFQVAMGLVTWKVMVNRELLGFKG